MACFIDGDKMESRKRKIEIYCPYCQSKSNPIPIAMGDKTIKCRTCGKYIRYGWRKGNVEIVTRPERTTAAGLTFY